MLMNFSVPKYSGESLDTHPGQLTDFEHLCTFMFAGNATLTLVSKRTGERFTYRIKAPPKGSEGPVSHFVAVLTGPQNTNDFTYLGHIFRESRDYVHGRKSKIGLEAPSRIAWEWFYGVIVCGVSLRPDRIEIWHEGRCGKCNRKLTVPESIKHGIGPECAKNLGYTYGQKELSFAHT